MLNPYKYSFLNNAYQFETKNNITYSVAFIEDHTLNSISSSDIELENIYQIIIDKVTDTKEPFDAQVFLTIDLIISDFFVNIENAIIYICSDDEGKEAKRFKAFNRWYSNSEHQEYITKVDNTLIFEEKNSVYYTSLLYHNENPNTVAILDRFNEIEKAINSEK